MRWLTLPHDRKLWVRCVAPENLSTLVTPSEPFACLLWSHEHTDDDVRYSFCRALIERGARYVCVGGVACSLWEDAFDDVVLERDLSAQHAEAFVITTQHGEEPLSEVLFFLLHCTKLDALMAVGLNADPKEWGDTIAMLIPHSL